MDILQKPGWAANFKPQAEGRISETAASQLIRQNKFFFCHHRFKEEIKRKIETFKQAWAFMRSIPDNWWEQPKFKNHFSFGSTVLVGEAQIYGGRIRAEVYIYAKSHKMIYTLAVGEKEYFIKETSCGKPPGRWGPFEMAGLIDLMRLETKHVKIIRPWASFSDGNTSFIVTDFMRAGWKYALNNEGLLSHIDGPLYSVYWQFANDAAKHGYWELGAENFFYDSRLGIVYAFDPFCNMPDSQNLANLFRVAGANSEYSLSTSVPDYLLSANFER